MAKEKETWLSLTSYRKLWIKTRWIPLENQQVNKSHNNAINYLTDVSIYFFC